MRDSGPLPGTVRHFYADRQKRARPIVQEKGRKHENLSLQVSGEIE